MSLPTRTLGRDGPTVTALGLGCMGLSAFYGPPPPDSERLAFLDRAYELGLTFWDSADIYQDNEDLLGQWFAKTGKRSGIFLATKFAINMSGNGPFVRGDREYVRQSVEKSLKRLGTDYIDLYYQHRPDPATPIEETMTELVALQKEGKIRHIGLSECSAATLRRASKIGKVTAYQIEYSPFFTDIELEEVGVLKACRELGIAIVPYSPLGRGFLTGKYKSIDDFPEGDFRRTVPRYNVKENFDKSLALVDEIQKLATVKGCTVGQLTLAWILAQGPDFVPIPGTTKIANLEENLGALKIQLSKEEEAQVRKAVDAAGHTGERYPKEMMGTLFGETPESK
ncbi:NADP-dependent oxidoreductase domain-containing protein [Pyronema omphalodes]|nr:NADP-dependent oxidoreductase domain-containing protein [Pyronema omphalodes]